MTTTMTSTTTAMSMMRHYARISASELKVGNMVALDDKLHIVNSAQFTRKAQGRPFIQVEMTSLNGKKKSHRFRSDEDVELADTERQRLRFVGPTSGDASKLDFLNTDTDETVTVPRELVGDLWVYLSTDPGASLCCSFSSVRC